MQTSNIVFEPLTEALKRTKVCKAIVGCQLFYKDNDQHIINNAFAAVRFTCSDDVLRTEVHDFILFLTTKFDKQYGSRPITPIGYRQYTQADSSKSNGDVVIKLMQLGLFNTAATKQKLHTAVLQLSTIVHEYIKEQP